MKYSFLFGLLAVSTSMYYSAANKVDPTVASLLDVFVHASRRRFHPSSPTAVVHSDHKKNNAPATSRNDSTKHEKKIRSS